MPAPPKAPPLPAKGTVPPDVKRGPRTAYQPKGTLPVRYDNSRERRTVRRTLKRLEEEQQHENQAQRNQGMMLQQQMQQQQYDTVAQGEFMQRQLEGQSQQHGQVLQHQQMIVARQMGQASLIAELQHQLQQHKDAMQLQMQQQREAFLLQMQRHQLQQREGGNQKLVYGRDYALLPPKAGGYHGVIWDWL